MFRVALVASKRVLQLKCWQELLLSVPWVLALRCPVCLASVRACAARVPHAGTAAPLLWLPPPEWSLETSLPLWLSIC